MAPGQTCRFYEAKFPEIDDVVMVNVRSVAEMGAYVVLQEYDNIDGMILLSELSRRRIRSINKLIKVGRQECVVVLRVDKDKGYIDLSKRRVSAEEISKCEDRYNKAKTVNGILRHVAELTGADLEDLYTRTAWRLDREMGGSYEAFKLGITEPEKVFGPLEINPKVKEVLIDHVKRRMTPQPTKIRADIEVSCFAYEGVDAVKAALREALALSTEAVPIKVNLIAPPLYALSTTSLDNEKGIIKLNEAIEAVKEKVGSMGGDLKVQNAPRAVSENEDRELSVMLGELERQNAEVPADDDNSGDDEEGAGGEEKVAMDEA